ncbi:hypothetical protein pb186bvf_015024 [Paramecium bursaria]
MESQKKLEWIKTEIIKNPDNINSILKDIYDSFDQDIFKHAQYKVEGEIDLIKHAFRTKREKAIELNEMIKHL